MKAPWKVLYSNDTTHILTCVSPWHRKGEPFREEMLKASVDETAGTGIEVHMLQPGLGVVPWWKSRQYPFAEHARWVRETYGTAPDSFAQYMLDGGDMVEVFVRRCRERGLVPFVSLRLNDGHGKEWVDGPAGPAPAAVPGQCWSCLSRFYKEHPEYRIGKSLSNWDERVLNWAAPEVRDWVFGYVRELCEGYDLDGFELDFMRHCSFFRQDETPSAERKRIMTGFVSRVRELLDRTARSGRRRWLCARVPAYLAAHDALGIDLRAMVDAGLDMVNLSYYYFTEQQGDYAEARMIVPDASLYVEMCHATRVGPAASDASAYDNFTFRRTTNVQFETTAHLAYSRGADGVSAFNFVYYREHGTPGRGPFREPPFEVFEHLGDAEWLARQQHHYFVGETWDCPPLPGRQLPRTVRMGETAEFGLNMCPTERGWRSDGRLRIQAAAPLGYSQWTARVNGRVLKETEDRSEPFPSLDPALLGGDDDHRAWIVPALALKNGVNTVEITLTEGDAARLVFVDIAMIEHVW